MCSTAAAFVNTGEIILQHSVKKSNGTKCKAADRASKEFWSPLPTQLSVYAYSTQVGAQHVQRAQRLGEKRIE